MNPYCFCRTAMPLISRGVSRGPPFTGAAETERKYQDRMTPEGWPVYFG